jgi:hypothetical protein
MVPAAAELTLVPRPTDALQLARHASGALAAVRPALAADAALPVPPVVPSSERLAVPVRAYPEPGAQQSAHFRREAVELCIQVAAQFAA